MDYGALITGIVVGIVVGTLSMLGLWVTVRSLASAQRPHVMLAASAGIRLLGLLAGLYFLAQSGPFALFGGLAGFIAARTVAIGLSRAEPRASFVSTRMDNH